MTPWQPLNLTDDELYEVEERAAIHEFDGRVPRAEAEQMSLREFRQQRNALVQAHIPLV